MQRIGIEDESKQITSVESSNSSNHSLLMTGKDARWGGLPLQPAGLPAPSAHVGLKT